MIGTCVRCAQQREIDEREMMVLVEGKSIHRFPKNEPLCTECKEELHAGLYEMVTRKSSQREETAESRDKLNSGYPEVPAWVTRHRRG